MEVWQEWEVKGLNPDIWGKGGRMERNGVFFPLL